MRSPDVLPSSDFLDVLPSMRSSDVLPSFDFSFSVLPAFRTSDFSSGVLPHFRLSAHPAFRTSGVLQFFRRSFAKNQVRHSSAKNREKERRPQPAGETVRERERENARKIRNGEMGLRPKFLHFMEDSIGRISSSSTVIRYRIGTGSIHYRTRSPL